METEVATHSSTQPGSFDREQIHLLEHIAEGMQLRAVLDEIVLSIEKQIDGMCTVLLFDNQTQTLQNGASPSVPQSYVKAIDGAKIGPHEGACGAAAYFKKRVI